MADSRDLDRLTSIDRDLVRVAKEIKILSHLAWPPAVGERFLADVARGDPRLPEIEYPRVDLSEDHRQLQQVMARCNRDHPVEDFLFKTARSYDRVVTMVECRGTPEFSRLSKLVYGSPADPVALDRTTTLAAARRLMDTTRDFAVRCGSQESDYCITPQTVAEALQREAAYFDRHAIEVVIDDTLAAKAAAGALRIRIRGATAFSNDDVAQLVQHELFVHTLTALNGRMQPVLQSMGLSAPRTTRTQEGLALFAELITNSIDIHRLRRIAARCIAIDLALNGADFVEVFRSFVESGQTDREAFSSAQRVFRGGDVRGGVAFTKDAVYLQGFVRIHGFLREAIRTGRWDFPSHLVSGRLRASDVPRLAPFFEGGMIQAPIYRPKWLERRSALVAFLLHATFITELHMEALDAQLPGAGAQSD